ncbi:MAG: TonB-dependent receptor plug domain-containing protein [Flavobacteriaceae bacterium]
MKTIKRAFICVFVSNILQSQSLQDSLSKTQLDEVVLTSARIDRALSKNARFIQTISQAEIRQSPAQNLAELLQQVAGVDIRRRGVAGMQADLFIRGGGFDQTLLLVDGIKLEDAQTGHHLLNFAPPLETIERIEIYKGPAARVFGQNAFTGAINIVTKTPQETKTNIGISGGSYRQRNVEATFQTQDKKTGFMAHYSHNNSEGYRYNTDFINNQLFFKGELQTALMPLRLLASFSDRKFGANGFYALPSYKEQYEETQASLLALSSQYVSGNWTFKPKLYLRRGQDLYLFLREDPSFYRNLHITHKTGIALDVSKTSDWGTTGMGIDVARTTISSNNLGDRDRLITTFFAEHQFLFGEGKWELTPGIAISQYSDFDAFFFPGIDIGYAFSDRFRVFANAGATYRIPTFTDLYYSDPTTLGNENLEVEEALTEEIGFRWIQSNFQMSTAAFYRTANNLIDYIRSSEEAPFQATNIRTVNTLGLDWEVKGVFYWKEQLHRINLGYTYLNDDLKSLPRTDSRYQINSLKHHLTFSYQAQWTKLLSTAVSYKYAQRQTQTPYTVVDVGIQWQLGAFQLEAAFNNIFNARYTETNLVPMPLGNGLFGIGFVF